MICLLQLCLENRNVGLVPGSVISFLCPFLCPFVFEILYCCVNLF